MKLNLSVFFSDVEFDTAMEEKALDESLKQSSEGKFALLQAADKGDLTKIKNLINDGVDAQEGDYDGRTA